LSISDYVSDHVSKAGLGVSVYGFEPESRTLSVLWPSGRTRRVKALAVLPDGVGAGDVDRLVAALDELSEAMWDTEVFPLSWTPI
jgi:hypothetical protein